MGSMIQQTALSLGVAWGSGINLYATMFVIGFLGQLGRLELPPGAEILQNPITLGIVGVMFVIEFFADKIPGFDSLWDFIHTFIRIPVGTFMATQLFEPTHWLSLFGSALFAGAVTSTSHVTKSGTRAVINTSPEPVTNWTASIAEDVAVVGGLWTALHYPIVFVILLVVFLVFAVWLLPKIYRGIRHVFKFFIPRNRSNHSL